MRIITDTVDKDAKKHDKADKAKEIEKIVKGRDFVAIADIPQLLGCSASTVRRDIKEMESRGLLTQSQGVVIWKAKSLSGNSSMR